MEIVFAIYLTLHANGANFTLSESRPPIEMTISDCLALSRDQNFNQKGSTSVVLCGAEKTNDVVPPAKSVDKP